MGNAESQVPSGGNTKVGGAQSRASFHPSLEALCRKLMAASSTGSELEMELMRRVFRLEGNHDHMTHLPSSPTRTGLSDLADRSHQAPTPSIGDYLLNYIVVKSRNQTGNLRAEDFLVVCQEIIDSMSETNYCAEMFVGYNTDESGWKLSSDMDEVHLRHALITAFYLYQNLHDGATTMTMEDQFVLNSLVISILNHKKTVTKDDLLSWIYENCPRMFGATHAWFTRAFVDEKGPIHNHPAFDCCPRAPHQTSLPPEIAFNSSPSSSAAPPPSSSQAASTRAKLVSRSSSASLKSMGSAHSDHALCPMLKWLLSGLLARSYYLASIRDKPEEEQDAFVDKIRSLSQPTNWTLLYDSNAHGHSMNRFQHHVFSYRGQSVMLIELEAGDLFVIASDEEWKESTSRFGGMDCVILEAKPRFRTRDSGRGVLYLNEWGRSLPKGVHLGRDPKSPILKIDSGFDLCTLANGMEQNIRAIEVWGCSSLFALDQQQSQKNWEQNQAVKGQTVRREAAFGKGGARAGWQDNPDRQILELGGITTDHNRRN